MNGTGHAPSHHGEILQGVFSDGAGVRCRALVTLPLTRPGTRAEFVREPDTGPDQISVTPADRTKAARAAVLTMHRCARLEGQRPSGGRLRLQSTIPIGLGMGSSTSDVIATVRAVAASFAAELPPEEIAALTVRAESACDPLMLGHRPLLFAQRDGRVLETLGEALPAAIVVGCTTGDGKPVDTLALPPVRYDDNDCTAYERLRVQLRTAIVQADSTLLGQVCTESARRNQRVLAKEEFGTLEEVATTAGAVGVQVAHSGNVAGVLFDPQVADLRSRLRQCIRTLRRHGIPVTRVFSTHRDTHPYRQGGRPCTTTSPTRLASQT